MKKRTMWKKILSALLCVCLLATSVTVGFVASNKDVSADAGSASQMVKRKELVFDSKGYEDATPIADTSNEPRTDTWWEIAGDLSPINEPGSEGNKVLWYRQNWYGKGEIIIGHDYKTNNVTNKVHVEPGKTYAISFDYKVLSETNNSALQIGVGVDKIKYEFHSNDFVENFTQHQVEITIAKESSDAVCDWTAHTAYITIPEDFSNSKDVLLIWVKGGNQTNPTDGKGGVLFDNVKVYSLAEYEETQLSYNDYSTAKAYENLDGKLENYDVSINACKYSGDVYVSTDPADENNKVMRYQHYLKGFGAITLGDEYEDHNPETYVGAKAGKTYRITFKWKTVNTARTTLTLGIALGTIGNGMDCVDDTTILGNNPIKTELVAIEEGGGSQYAEWQNQTAYITVPFDYQDMTHNRLMIYAQGGGSNKKETVNEVTSVTEPSISLYFDDITVTEVAGVHVYDGFVDQKLSYNDYESVKSEYIYDASSDVEPWAWQYHMTYGSFFACKDPDDLNNTVMRFKHYTTDIGAITLGASLSNDLTTGRVVAKKGMAYKVEYKWKTTGTAYREVKIGVAIGKQNPEDKYFQDTSLQQTKVHTVIAGGGVGSSGWKNEIAYIAVDDNLDTSVYNRLVIYAQGGGTRTEGSDFALYIDDITVTELAGANVDYIVEGTKNTELSGFSADGCVHNHTLTNEAGGEVKWYLDKEYTNPITFDANGCYDLDSEFTETTVYGKYSPVVTYYINQHIAGSTLPYDGIKKSYDSEQASLSEVADVVKGTVAEDKLSSDLQFEGWYSLSFADNAYRYDKKVTTVAEAIEAGGVYAKYTRTNSTTTEYDIVGPVNGTATNSYYKNFMAPKDDKFGDMYSLVYEEEQWIVKFSSSASATGKKSLLIVNPSQNEYAPNNAIMENTYATMQLGTAYKVTLKYKVNEKPSTPMEIELWSAPITRYYEDSCKHYFMEMTTVSDKTDGWQEATAYFTAEALAGLWSAPDNIVKSTGMFADALSIVTFGVGDIYYDDITVTALSETEYAQIVAQDKLNFNVSSKTDKGVVSFEDEIEFRYNKTGKTIDVQSDNYQPRINGFTVNNQKVYENFSAAGTTFKATYNTSGETAVSMGLYNRLDCDNTSNFSVVAGIKADDDSMRFILRTYSDYENYGYFGNVAYNVVDRGVLVALTNYAGYSISADNILPTTDGVQKISCMDGLYEQTNTFYDYTVCVDGVTDLFTNSNISVRGYMTLTNGNTEFTVFSDNVLTNSLLGARDGSIGEDTSYTSQVDSDLEILQSGITSVTMSLYGEGEYGIAWITDANHEENAIEIIAEDGDFANPLKTIADIKVTEYTTHVLKEGYDYLDFKAEWGRKGEGSGNLWEETSMNSTRYSNKGVISGLEEGKTYKYRVGYKNSNGVWIYSYTGTLNVPKSDTNGFKFVYMTDSQQDFSTITSPLTRTLDAISKHIPDAEFIAHGGDIIHYNAYEEQWKRLLDANKRYFMSIPFMPAAGNHEYSMVAIEGYDYYQHFNLNIPESAMNTPEKEMNGYSGAYYSYDYKNVHFVVLNTNEGYLTGTLDSDMPFKLTDAQVNWLTSDLDAANENKNIDFTIVYMHCGLYMTGAFGSNQKDNKQSLTLRKQLQKLFCDKGVDLVMDGHDHIYSVTNVLDEDGNPVTDTAKAGVVHMTGAIAGINSPSAPLINDGDQYPIDAKNGVYASVIGKQSYCWSELNVTSDKITVTTYTADTEQIGRQLHTFDITKNNVGNQIPADGTVIDTVTQ